MKKLIAAFLFCLPFSASCLTNHYSRTYLFTRPAYQNCAVTESILFPTYPELCEHHFPWYIQMLGFFQKTSALNNTKDQLCTSHTNQQQYFLMKGHNSLSVKGDNVSLLDRDIRAEWLNLPSNFSGTFSVYPQQHQAGYLVTSQAYLRDFFSSPNPFFECIWVNAMLAYASVCNNLNPTQDIINTGGTHATILDALAGPTILFNKVLPGSSHNTGFTELRCGFGSTTQSERGSDLKYYAFLSIPLNKPQRNIRLFEPIRGFNGHFCLGAGVDIDILLSNPCTPCRWYAALTIENMYRFKHHEIRTIDLYNKPWSRFLLLDSKTGARNIPAINVLSQCFEISPYNCVDLAVRIRALTPTWNIELDYCLWAQGQERLTLQTPWKEEFGISAQNNQTIPDPYYPLPQTASRSTIARLALPDVGPHGEPLFVPIRTIDLDLCSGGAASTVTHRLQSMLDLHITNSHMEGILGLGCFYEFTQNNASFDQWGIFAKLGAGF